MLTYDEKRNICIKLEKRSQDYQSRHNISELQYNRDDIYTALHTLNTFFHANAPLSSMTAITDKNKLPNPAVAYAGAHFLMMISELQTQGVLDTEDFVTISDNLTDHEGIALAYVIASHCK